MASSYKAFKRKTNGTRTARAKNLTIRRKKARLDKLTRFL